MRDGQDNVANRLYGEGEYRPTGAQKYVYLTDQLGSVRDVVDATTGALVGSLDYSPYGQVQRQSGSVSPIIQYGQLPWDANVGLSVSPTRLYDASVGRWLSRDPIREAGGINLYAYVGGSPTLGIDPDGQNPAAVVVAACAANPIACAAVVVGGIGTTVRQLFFPPSNPVLVPIYPMAKPPRTKDVPEVPGDGEKPCYKKKKSGLSGKEASSNIPSWARGERPFVGESGKDFAKRLLDNKYGVGKYPKGAGEEFNILRKYGDQAFE